MPITQHQNLASKGQILRWAAHISKEHLHAHGCLLEKVSMPLTVHV